MIKLELVGADKLVAGFEKYKVESEKAIDRAVMKTTFAIETDAKKRLFGEHGSGKHWIKGRLSASIFKRKIKSGEGVVGTNVNYAPYVEFGTGEKVFTNFDFDAEAKKVAAQYKGKKLTKGMRGDSYLVWALENQKEKHKERIIEELNKIR
jgi:hypothetical protein